MPGDSPVLLWIPDIELLGTLKIMCEVVGGQQADREVNSQTMQLSNGPSCKANTNRNFKSNNVDAADDNLNMPDYFRSSMKKADKKIKPSINAKNTK